MSAELADVSSLEEAAVYLRLTPEQLRALVRRRQIGFLRSGRILTFPAESLRSYVELHTQLATAPHPFGLTDASARRLRTG